MTNRIIENSHLRKAMDKAGLEHFSLAKGVGYFYVVGNEKATQEEKYLAMDADDILEYAFNRQSIDKWVRDIKEVLHLDK